MLVIAGSPTWAFLPIKILLATLLPPAVPVLSPIKMLSVYRPLTFFPIAVTFDSVTVTLLPIAVEFAPLAVTFTELPIAVEFYPNALVFASPIPIAVAATLSRIKSP